MQVSILEPLGIDFSLVENFVRSVEDLGHSCTYYDTKATEAVDLIARSKDQDVVIIANNPYPNEVVLATNSLQLLAVAFTGIDHVGLDACKQKGVMLSNCAGYSDQAVAELAIGLTLSLYRRILQSDLATREGKGSSGLIGQEIAGKKVGIVGCGRIGYRTAKLFAAFGSEVYAYSRRVNPSYQEGGIRYVDRDTLFSSCDIISLHLPSTTETKHFVDAKVLALMKSSAILINCARGPIVDSKALATALVEGKLAGAAIDVFEMEPPIPHDHPLCMAPNTLLTPHVAYLTQEAMIRRAQIVFTNVIEFLNNKKVLNRCKF